jgi:tetratricopeptide (TPR) repeat protein
MLAIRHLNTILIIIGLCILTAGAQAGSTIEGRVTGPNHQSLANVRVTLQTDTYAEREMVYTDGSGRFRFRGVPAGVFYVVVESLDGSYEKQSRQVDINPANIRRDSSGRLTGGEYFYEDFSLKPRRLDGGLGMAPGKPAAVFAQQVPEPARREYEAALKNFDSNKAAEGMAALKHAVELFPDYYDALDRLGGEYVRQHDAAAAVPVLEHATQVNKDGWTSFYYLGVAQIEANRREEGLRSLRRAVELNPNSVNASMRLGVELAKDPQAQAEAIEAMKRVAQLAGKQVPDCYFYLAKLYNQGGQYKESADALENYLKLNPKVDSAQREQYKKVIETLRRKAQSK